MDYGKVLGRAWEITWRWKVLWILGFLASLGSGMGGSSSVYQADEADMQRLSTGQIPPEWLAWGVGILVAVACLALIAGIILWVVSIMARGGLIAGVQQVEDEGATAFSPAWRVGRKRFWTLFGVNVLASIPIIVAAIVLVIVLAASLVTIAGSSETPQGLAEGGIALAVICGGALCCGLILVSVVLDQIRTYAERAAILEGLSWLDAFGRGWRVLREHIGPTIIFWLIFLVIGLAVALVIGGAIAVTALPLIAVFTQVEPGPWMIAPICFGGLLAILVGAVLNSIVQTFTSATWTLVYRELTGYRPQEANLPAPEA